MMRKCLSVDDEKINYNKIISKTEIEPGDRVEITWSEDYGFQGDPLKDQGYAFAFPGTDPELELMVHIPKPSGGEKCQPEPVWISVAELLSNDQVVAVRKIN